MYNGSNGQPKGPYSDLPAYAIPVSDLSAPNAAAGRASLAKDFMERGDGRSALHGTSSANPWYASNPTSSRNPQLVSSMSQAMFPPPAFPPAPASQEAEGSNSSKPGDKKKKRRADGDGLSVEEKRTKTGRACDACRSKKIRCDILTAAAQAAGQDIQPICAHCKQYSLECTFFLPITETRFKKRRAAADDSASAAVAQPKTEAAGASTPSGGKAGSVAFLLGSSLPRRSFEQHDISNHNHWEVTEDKEGRLRVSLADDGEDGSLSSSLEKYVLPADTMTTLLNTFFDYDLQFLPVVLRQELLAEKRVYPFLLYAICGLASTRREFPRHIFQRLRGVLNSLIRSNDLLSNARLEHVQALIIMAHNGEINAQPTAATASASMLRVTIAIRMAQDLGLHRESKTPARTHAEIEQIELRRRIWAVTLCLDSWYGAALGNPLIVDIHDCDVLFPASYRVVADAEPSSWPTELSYLALGHHLKLCILLSRVLRTVYGPAGLRSATDAQLESIISDLLSWHDNLPEQLRYKCPDDPLLVGILQLAYTAVQFLFWRAFIRVADSPSHIKFTLDVKKWAQLVHNSRLAIEWINANNPQLDTFFHIPYAATSCALVQYHHWARHRDPAALETLKLVKDMVSRWEEALQPDQMSIRRKTMETMTLLYEAAIKTNAESEDSGERSETPNSSTAGDHPPPAFKKRRASGADPHVGFSGDVVTDGPHMAAYRHVPDLSPPDEAPFDASILDSLPDANFDFQRWGQYFENVDRMFAPVPKEVDEDEGDEEEYEEDEEEIEEDDDANGA
ncbi:Acetamidase regulatory protein [Vanrija pseudolonga]|uniref:Acetamidase regulatory protein n=1 Tax=Vanrija pseudolonga TaxID=143232 RepID=A0AAF1BMH4_9TREE|nr:Acetamidase regulatory protein [Vanrija pseudolonga]